MPDQILCHFSVMQYTKRYLSLSPDPSQGMTNKHILIGNHYSQIPQLLLCATRLQDQGSVVAYETNDQPAFSALVSELRMSDTRLYELPCNTLLKTP